MDRRLLRALFGPGGGLSHDADLPDADLLARFAAGGSRGETGAVESGTERGETGAVESGPTRGETGAVESGTGRDEAFAEIVRRHGPLVWAVCRRSLPDRADAEDAFQATFLALVKSPRSVRQGLPGWLHGVAVRVAANVRRSAGRRRRREAAAAVAEGQSPVPDSLWAEAFAAVHEEVARLPAGLRAAFLLCEVARVPHAEAARRLGWKPGTLSGTLARARQRLATRLAARGLAPAVLAGALAGEASAVPWKLVEVVNTFSGAAGTVPAAVARLAAEGVVMGGVKLKAIAAAVVVAGGLTLGLGPAALPSADAQGFGRGGEAKPVMEGAAADAPKAPAPASSAGAPSVPQPTPAFVYLYEEVPADQAAFAKLVDQLGVKGYEYVGPNVTAKRFMIGAPDTKLVFKRQVRAYEVGQPRAASAPAGADAAALRMVRDELATLQRNPDRATDLKHVVAILDAVLRGDAARTVGPAGILPPGGAPAPTPAPTLDPPATAAPVPARPAPSPQPGGSDAGATEQLRAELARANLQMAVLKDQLETAARKPAGVGLFSGAAPPAAEPAPAVFDVPGGAEWVTDLVPVIEAGLGRESAKLGGPVRIAALGRQIILFGATAQTGERVQKLAALVGAKLTPAKPKPDPAGPADPDLPAPAGMRGAVTRFVAKGNVVELTPGLDAGLRVGARASVSRVDGSGNGQFLGTLKVTQVDPKTAVATFYPANLARARTPDDDPQPGDIVTP